MHPFVINTELWGIPIIIPTYPLFMLLGIVVFAIIYYLNIPYIKSKALAHIVFLSVLLISGAIGARIMQFIINLTNNNYRGLSVLEMLLFSGATINGGIFWGIITIIIYRRFDKQGIVTWQTVDVIAAGFPLAHMCGRIGCFFTGCCYGKICPDCAFTITYPDEWLIDRFSKEYIPHGPRIPAPLIAALGLLIIGITLLLILRFTKKRGQVVALYGILYGTFRFFNEFLRDDKERGFWGIFSTGQWFGLLLLAGGIILLIIFIIRYVKTKTLT